MSLALGSTLIAVGPGLTCYYCFLILAVTLLHARRDAVGPLLLGVTALSQAVTLPPIQVAQSVMVNPIGPRWFAMALLALALVMDRAALRPGAPAAAATLLSRFSGRRGRVLPHGAVLGRPDIHRRDRGQLDELPLRRPLSRVPGLPRAALPSRLGALGRKWVILHPSAALLL